LLLRSLRDDASSQAPLIAAEWSAVVLLLLTYQGMSTWSLIPTVALLLLMARSYSLFLDIRETYQTTVEVLVEAAESQDDRRVGHADRTATIARSIAEKMGLSAPEVERVGYAALLHDLGELAEQSPGGPSECAIRVRSADVVKGVEFFRRIEPVLVVCDGIDDSEVSESDLVAGLVVALASDIDAASHPYVAAAHACTALAHVMWRVTPRLEARAVGAASSLGYRFPAVD